MVSAPALLTSEPDTLIHDRVTVRAVDPEQRFVFRGGGDAVRICGESFGISLPLGPCRAATRDGKSALWMGPDEWLLIAPEQALLLDSLRAALAACAHGLVDVSSRDHIWEITGSSAELLLNAGVPLDLSLTAFPADCCTRTVFGKVGAMLWRNGPESFRLSVARSLAPYVGAWLREAAQCLPEGEVSPQPPA